ncbi:MAG: D-glycero-beta-D-manno-heptose 1,7-bisphosphate 7-phosphatase [Desulfobacteraceae bacterium]|nr:D-glycero-beta-D-manno-heptose 1,7-bisphosphate 7-phosphatase [Desulfobacteraceae bacterium]
MYLFRHVILDRDGVLNYEAPGGYVTDPDQWAWIEGVLDALAKMAQAGLRLSVATNQSCVGRGIIDQQTLEIIHDRMRRDAAAKGIFFSGIHFCPHTPDQGCSCRKPEPGLIEQAVQQSGISKNQTVFIGDSQSDLQAGRAAGIATWLVRTGKGKNTEAALKDGMIQGIRTENVQVFNNLGQACAALLATT